MPSSTSSSERRVPDRPWLRLALAAAILSGLGVGAWEFACRSRGYRPSYEDTPDLWAARRDRVEPDSLVIVGSSRVLFDLDLEILERGLGIRPLQLAVVGSCPRPFLADLAGDPDFRGTLLVGYTPNLFFAPGGPLLQKSLDWLDARARRSPSRRFGAWLGWRLDERLAMIQQEDLTLSALLGSLPWPDRPDSAVAPRMPPQLGHLDLERRCRMIRRLERDPGFQGEVQGIWKGLLQAAPPMSPEAARAIRDRLVAGTAAQVARLRERGGRVVFLRLPSTGWFRDFEGRTAPRDEYWERLLEATGAPGIHFEDHPELARWDCPEWSHLTSGDSVSFTEALAPHLERAL